MKQQPEDLPARGIAAIGGGLSWSPRCCRWSRGGSCGRRRSTLTLPPSTLEHDVYTGDGPNTRQRAARSQRRDRSRDRRGRPRSVADRRSHDEGAAHRARARLARGHADAGTGPTPGTPAWADTADVTEHLGEKIPLDLPFRDSTGADVTLRPLFDGTHPVYLMLAYYECPQLCSLVLDAATTRCASSRAGACGSNDQYRAVTISFDATENTDQAGAQAREDARRLAVPRRRCGEHRGVARSGSASGSCAIREPARSRMRP